MYNVTQYGWEIHRGNEHLHVETLMLLPLRSHITGTSVFCANYYRLRLKLFIRHRFKLISLKNGFSSKLKVTNSPPLNLMRWASFQEQISVLLKLSCAIFKKKTKKKTFQSNLKADCNPTNQNLFHSLFFPDCNKCKECY